MNHITAPDCTSIALHRMGEGRPVLMLHGLFSSAQMNWIKYGHAPLLAENGFECIMPDWRVHGDSEAPTDPALYEPGVLVRDALHIVETLGLTDYDLVGFSLGARTATSAVIAGLQPRRLVLGGMGIEGLSNWEQRSAFFVDMIDRFDEIERGDPAFLAKSFMKAQGIDREAARLLLTRGVEDIALADLSRITMPTLVLIGDEDRDNGSPEKLRDALPDAEMAVVPGNHMGSVTKKDMGRAILDFLS
ncbi:alpha/beta fold hydrolase [Aurantiacibacter poecillastricola]|uniref:alpha/beta fold hydrolase n=1 Tax=Aurantiacibacter poecillastricola TaxID=3064385 RepID=UPI00273DFFB9|nr:alpha/beta fold hydrolase [Aurantiacibacter sp. 219JJ12-13]MDP5261775.1 alpha/beta fold hydrolase [Aurantiacibacter sp. 219JJ12-13]